jgi:hypothetical protein
MEFPGSDVDKESLNSGRLEQSMGKFIARPRDVLRRRARRTAFLRGRAEIRTSISSVVTVYGLFYLQPDLKEIKYWTKYSGKLVTKTRRLLSLVYTIS